MRLPIALALGWPDRVPGAAPGLDLSAASTWDFAPLDEQAFPAVRLARRAGQAGGTYPAVYNAANEECVAAFLAGGIGFLDIVATVERVVAEHAGVVDPGLDDVLLADAWARRRAREVLVAPAGRGAGEGTG
jgi:1-deoxy-D-xylulose-5-phosphate reductoisomerase